MPKRSSIIAMAFSSLLCLVATAMAMTDGQKLAPVALMLFGVAFATFSLTMALPLELRRRKPQD